MTPDTAALRTNLAGVLAQHTDQLINVLHRDATTRPANQRPGLNRAARLLTLHKEQLLADTESASIRVLLDVMTQVLTVDEGPLNPPADPGVALAEYIFSQPRDVVEGAFRHLGWSVPAPAAGLAAEVERLQRERQLLIDQLAAKDARTGTRPCGHDDYHDPHEWADRPGMWCPGISSADDEPAIPAAESE